MSRVYYLLCDLVDEPAAIAAYEAHHAPGKVWPAVVESIAGGGITRMEIFRAGNRLIMVMEVSEQYDAAAREQADQNNDRVQEWERLMDRYQQRLPFAKPGEKWVEARQIFDLGAQTQ